MYAKYCRSRMNNVCTVCLAECCWPPCKSCTANCIHFQNSESRFLYDFCVGCIGRLTWESAGELSFDNYNN